MAVATRPRSVEEIKADLEAIKAKKEVKPKIREKPGYYGLVFCDDYGWCWLADDSLQTKCLGKTEEVVPYLKKRKISGEDVDGVFKAIKTTPREKKMSLQGQIITSEKSKISEGDGAIKVKRLTLEELRVNLGIKCLESHQTHREAQNRRVTKGKAKQLKGRKATPAVKPGGKRGKSQR